MKFADKYSIKSTRLPNHNYSSIGTYFITICTLHHNNFFGKIIDNQIIYSKQGQIALSCLLEVPNHFPNVCFDAYVIMPNHVHLLFHVETPYMASLQDSRPVPLIKYDHKNHPDYYSRINQKSKQLIPKIIQQYKSAVTRKINPKTFFFAWQSRYHDIIVKDNKQFGVIKNYIIDNPVNWQKDKYYKT